MSVEPSLIAGALGGTVMTDWSFTEAEVLGVTLNIGSAIVTREGMYGEMWEDIWYPGFGKNLKSGAGGRGGGIAEVFYSFLGKVKA